MIFRRLTAFPAIFSLLASPALAADKKPLVLSSTTGQQQQIQSGDTLAVPNAKVTSITGSTQCVQASTAGLLSGTGAACGGSTGANPTATASDTAVNGVATTFMRSDAAPAVQKASSSVFGIVKVDGTSITATGGVISAVGGGGSGAITLISEVVTSGSQTSVTFSSIPATYRDLIVMVRGRLTAAVSNEFVRAQFNSDTGTNYDYELFRYYGSTLGNGQSTAQTSAQFGELPGASATANFSAVNRIYIGDYRGTTFYKSWFSDYGIQLGTGSSQVGRGASSGTWKSTSAITSITIFLGSSAGFVNGSVVSLYGSN